MMLNDIPPFLNSIAGAVIALQLIFFSKQNRKHRLGIAVISWLFISLYASIPIMTIFGDYVNHSWLETIINTLIAGIILFIRGNLGIFIDALKYVKSERKDN